jgi:hypothetical protein
MTSASIKIVRPWPAEQPRPPVAHRTEGLKAAVADPSLRQRPAKTKIA